MVVLVGGPWAGRSQRWRHEAWTAATLATCLAIWAAVTAWINRGEVDGSMIGGPAIWLHLAVLAAMVGAGAAVDWMIPRNGSPQRSLVATPESTRPESTEVSWSGTVTHRRSIVGACAFGVSAVLMGAFDLRLATMNLIAGVGALASARLAVSVDGRGVIVTRGLRFLPRTHIPLDQIVSADSDLVHPKDWMEDHRLGPIRMLARSAVIREGPGMVVKLVDGEQFAVSLDDPYPATVAQRACLTSSGLDT